MSVDFIDTNVFIYLFDEADSQKREVSRSLINEALASGSGRISFQVVQESLNVLTMKLGASTDDAQRFYDAVLEPLWSVAPSSHLYKSALELRDRYRFSYYDSLIIAAARSAGADRLLSEDLQDGQVIGDMVITNPFG